MFSPLSFSTQYSFLPLPLQNQPERWLTVVAAPDKLVVLAAIFVLVDLVAVKHVAEDPARVSNEEKKKGKKKAVVGDNSHEPSGHQETEYDGVALVELRALRRGIHKHRHKTATVGNCELESGGRGALVVARRVVGKPSKDGRHAAVQARGHQERHAVLDVGTVHIGNHGIPDNGNGHRDEHNDATDLEMVGSESDND